jgi:hypothetical protein
MCVRKIFLEKKNYDIMLCGCEVNAYIRSRTQCHIQKTLFKLQIHAATLECSK